MRHGNNFFPIQIAEINENRSQMFMVKDATWLRMKEEERSKEKKSKPFKSYQSELMKTHKKTSEK